MKSEKEVLRNQAYMFYLTIGGLLSEKGFQNFKEFLFGEDEKKQEEADLEQFGIKTETKKKENYKIIKEIKL